MKKLLWWVAAVLVSGSTASAEPGLRVQADTLLSWTNATSSYDFSAKASDTETVASQLDFPDPAGAWGLGLEWQSGASGLGDHWGRVEAAVQALASVNRMEDRDWYGLIDYPNVPRILFSDTTSATSVYGGQARWTQADALVRGSEWSLDRRWGLGGRWTHWTALGVEGWTTLDSNGNWTSPGAFGIGEDTDVLTYDLWSVQPFVGLGLRLVPAPAWDLGLSADLGLEVAGDYDDHLLRGKWAKSVVYGWAGRVGAQGRWAVEGQGLYLGFGVQAWGSLSSGLQTQYWYQAEGSTPAGTTMDGLAHRIFTAGWLAQVSLGTRL